MEFDPEPLGFVEKRSEEGFMAWGGGVWGVAAEANTRSDRERGGGVQMFVARRA